MVFRLKKEKIDKTHIREGLFLCVKRNNAELALGILENSADSEEWSVYWQSELCGRSSRGILEKYSLRPASRQIRYALPDCLKKNFILLGRDIRPKSICVQ